MYNSIKSISFLIALFALTTSVFGQEKVPFPTMKTQTVKSETLTIPEDTKGKYTLLGLAYSKKSEKSLDTWYKPVFTKFIKPKLEKSAFSSLSYDINVYFVPMFTGVSAAAAGAAKKKALAEVDPRIQPYILFYKGKLAEYKKKLHFYKKDVPYFILLDEEGNIVYETSGDYTSQKLTDIESQIDDF